MNFPEQRKWLEQKVQEKQQQKFYGKITISLCAGNIVHAEVIESLKVGKNGESSEEKQTDDRKAQRKRQKASQKSS